MATIHLLLALDCKSTNANGNTQELGGNEGSFSRPTSSLLFDKELVNIQQTIVTCMHVQVLFLMCIYVIVCQIAYAFRAESCL